MFDVSFITVLAPSTSTVCCTVFVVMDKCFRSMSLNILFLFCFCKIALGGCKSDHECLPVEARKCCYSDTCYDRGSCTPFKCRKRICNKLCISQSCVPLAVSVSDPKYCSQNARCRYDKICHLGRCVINGTDLHMPTNDYNNEYNNNDDNSNDNYSRGKFPIAAIIVLVAIAFCAPACVGCFCVGRQMRRNYRQAMEARSQALSTVHPQEATGGGDRSPPTCGVMVYNQEGILMEQGMAPPTSITDDPRTPSAPSAYDKMAHNQGEIQEVPPPSYDEAIGDHSV